MKVISLLLVLLFSATVVPASAQIGPDGTGVVNGYIIGPNALLAGANLNGANLSGANLSGADLNGANLGGAILLNATLRGADLTGANLPMTDLTGADLTGANLTGANFLESWTLTVERVSGLRHASITPMMTAIAGNGDDIQTLKTSDTTNTAAIAANATNITNNTSEIEAIKAQLATLVDALAAKDAEIEQQSATIAELSTRPTAEQLAAVEAERDARFTEDQIHAMSANPTVKINDAGNIQVDLSFIQSSDMENFAPFTVTPDLVSVVDGKICVEFPPTNQDTFFFRLGVE